MTHTHLLLVVCLLYVSCHDVKLVLLCHMTVAVAEGVALFFLNKNHRTGGGNLFSGVRGGEDILFSLAALFIFTSSFSFFVKNIFFLSKVK